MDDALDDAITILRGKLLRVLAPYLVGDADLMGMLTEPQRQVLQLAAMRIPGPPRADDDDFSPGVP